MQAGATCSASSRRNSSLTANSRTRERGQWRPFLPERSGGALSHSGRTDWTASSEGRNRQAPPLIWRRRPEGRFRQKGARRRSSTITLWRLGSARVHPKLWPVCARQRREGASFFESLHGSLPPGVGASWHGRPMVSFSLSLTLARDRPAAAAAAAVRNERTDGEQSKVSA